MKTLHDFFVNSRTVLMLLISYDLQPPLCHFRKKEKSQRNGLVNVFTSS